MQANEVSNEASTTVMTVRGPIPAADLGVVMMHEHVLIDMVREFRMEGLLNNVPLAIEELKRFRLADGLTIVDLTNANLGRHPKALRHISEVTGIQIVLGSGLYRQAYFDRDWVDRYNPDEIAKSIVEDITIGIDQTDIRAGVIGEIGCDQWLTAQEERAFRGAARAHHETGVTISTHAARWPVGISQLDLLEEEGVDLRRVVIGHCDTVASPEWTSTGDPYAYHNEIARRGAYVQFDTIRPGPEVELQRRVDFVVNMVEKGYERQVLLAHDICKRSHLRAYGGGGYGFILEHFVPRLKENGLSEGVILGILVDNPRNALTGGR